MKKWEYKTLGYRTISTSEQIREFQKYLEDYGNEGWELISKIGDSSSYLFVFKRPVKKVISKPVAVNETVQRKFSV